MPAIPVTLRMTVAVIVAGSLAAHVLAQETVALSEEFKPGYATAVEIAVGLEGKLTIPGDGKTKAPQVLTVSGKSRVTYDERILPADTEATVKTIRVYRDVAFLRTLGNAPQEATIRPAVRRMVVIKSGGRRAPFSPDGPLTWGEIDVVRTDVFNPVVVAGLLPAGPVRKGDSWKASTAAVAELTDMEKVETGELTVEFVGVGENRLARLKISGTIRGVNEDGPNQQKLEGHAFYSLDTKMLTYLSLRGSHDLLDGKGQALGHIEGQFTLSRSRLAALPADLADAALAGIELKPTVENSLLLYDNPQLGIRFLYPRGWRIGVVQGRQVTLDHARGAGVFFTVEPPARIPTADDYLKEVSDFLQKQKKAQIANVDRPARVRSEPVLLDRFGFDAAFGKERVRMECAVLRQSDGGVAVAATIPAAELAALKPEVDRIIRSLSVTKKIEEK